MRALMRTIQALILSMALYIMLAGVCQAAGVGYLEQDKTTNVVQGAAPNGLLSQTLTVNSTTLDATGSLWWGLYPPSAGCKVRLMPTAAKGTYPQFTASDGTWTTRLVNRATPFVNFSGCTLGELQRQ